MVGKPTANDTSSTPTSLPEGRPPRKDGKWRPATRGARPTKADKAALAETRRRDTLTVGTGDDVLTVTPCPDPADARGVRAPPPPTGYRYTPTGRLVPAQKGNDPLQSSTGRAVFAEVLETTGSWRAACDALGIVDPRVPEIYMAKGADRRSPDGEHVDGDPDAIAFAHAVANALERHRQSIYAAAVQRAVHGYEVPVIGGQFKDEIVAYERRYSDTLAALLLKRHFQEFRDAAATGSKVAVNVTQTNANVGKAEVVLPDLSKLTREQRQAMRLLLADAPAQVTTVPELVLDAESEEKA